GNRRALILGETEYDGSVNVNSAYGYTYGLSESGDGSIVFIDGFDVYKSDPLTGTVAIGDRTYRVILDGDTEGPNWSCSLVEVRATSMKSGASIINVPQTDKEYAVTLLEDGTYVLEDTLTSSEYTSHKSVKIDSAIFRINEPSEGVIVLEEEKQVRPPKNYTVVEGEKVGYTERDGGGDSLVNMFGELYDSDIYTEDSFSVLSETTEMMLKVTFEGNTVLAVFDEAYGLSQFISKIKGQMSNVFAVDQALLNVEIFSVGFLESEFAFIAAGEPTQFEDADARAAWEAHWASAHANLSGISVNRIGDEGLCVAGKGRVPGVTNGYYELSVVRGVYGLYDFDYLHNTYDGYSNEWFKNYDAMVRSDRYTLYDYGTDKAGYAADQYIYAYANEMEKAMDPSSGENARDYLTSKALSRIDMMRAAYRVSGFNIAGKDFNLVKDELGQYTLIENHSYDTHIDKDAYTHEDEDEDIIQTYEFTDDQSTLHRWFYYIGEEQPILEAVAGHFGILPGDITVGRYSLAEIRSVYSTGSNPILMMGIQYDDDALLGETFATHGVKYTVEVQPDGTVDLAYDDTSENIIVHLEFVGDNNDGQGEIKRDILSIYDGTFDEDKFLDYLKTKIASEYTVTSADYTTTMYSLKDLRGALVYSLDVYADPEDKDPATELVALLNYSRNSSGERFFIGDDRYRVFENSCNADEEDILIAREKFDGGSIYSIADYSVSVAVEDMFKLSDVMYTAVNTTDPLQAEPDHAGHEKYYHEFYTFDGFYTASFPNVTRGTWQVKIADKTYDLVIDELEGTLTLREISETSDSVTVFEYDSVYTGQADDDVERREFLNLRTQCELAYNMAAGQGDPIDPNWFSYFTQIERKYRITETDGGAIRYGKVKTQAGGFFSDPAGVGVI
ncbi:MAG: hypothetical protein WBD12_05230, partial [Candidatus Omnitrophota bacterium]